jgi:ABC-type uncharacterized transport system ATPase subunit
MIGMSQLRVESLTKVYSTLIANDAISMEVQPGEIHAVLGENGAGKSTLMKMIYGVTQPTSGKIIWEGSPVQIRSTAQARALGIGMVFQHFSLFESLTVLENTALALDNHARRADLSGQIAEISAHYGLPVHPDRLVHDLSVGERQRVEIIRCLLQRPRLLIMDEPTSVLSPGAVEKLFETLRAISQEGCAILYISHKLDEIRSLCDTATILRAGRVTGSCTPRNESPQSLAKMMIGKEFDRPRRTAVAPGETVLALHQCSKAAGAPFGVDLHDISLSVRAGEILGIAGISGNGQNELCELLSGEVLSDSANDIEFMGIPIGLAGVDARRAQGLAYVPEDRLGQGSVTSMSLTENLMLTGVTTLGLVKGGMLQLSKAAALTQDCIHHFNVKASGPDAAAGALSGGNLQKFIAGREMLQKPKVMICAQPTWGVDVGATAFIRQSLIDLARAGCAVIILSEELEELFEVSDRIAVLSQGRLSPIKSLAETTVEQIGLWMGGVRQEGANAAA